MQHLSNSARGKVAQNQQELLRIAMNSSPIQEEILEHPITATGFYEYGEQGLERMSDYTFVRMLTTLLKFRPASRLWDIVPDVPYTEDKILIESPEAYRMTFEQKAQFFRDEFLRRPRMVGLRMELHNIDRKTDSGSGGQQSVSFTVYEATDDLGDTCVPVTIRARYRTNF